MLTPLPAHLRHRFVPTMIQHRGPYQSQLDVRREGDGRGLDIADLAQNSGVCSPCSPSSGDKLVAYDTYDNAVLTYLRGFKQITKPEGNKLDIERTKTRVKARKQLSPVSRHAMMVNYPPEARHKLTSDGNQHTQVRARRPYSARVIVLYK